MACGFGMTLSMVSSIELAPSLTWTVKLGAVAVGVPLMTPLLLFKVSPAGRLPLVTDQL